MQFLTAGCLAWHTRCNCSSSGKLAHQKNYKGIIMKARHLVGQIRKSSVIVEKLVERSGKNVVSDCSTRWNSTFQMAKRLLDIKNHVNHVLGEAGIDTLVASEWAKLDEMANLLEPFACHTDILQTDYQSVSYILPSLLDLECHLQQFPSAKTATTLMLSDFRSRFATILDPQCHNFNPIPVAACLLDNTVAAVLMTSATQHLMEAAEAYLISQVFN